MKIPLRSHYIPWSSTEKPIQSFNPVQIPCFIRHFPSQTRSEKESDAKWDAKWDFMGLIHPDLSFTQIHPPGARQQSGECPRGASAQAWWRWAPSWEHWRRGRSGAKPWWLGDKTKRWAGPSWAGQHKHIIYIKYNIITNHIYVLIW